MNRKSIYFTLILIHSILSKDLNLSIDRFNINETVNSRSVSHLLGIMVDFQLESIENGNYDSETSGNGKFLGLEDLDISYINYPDISRCNSDDKLVIDKPPHNAEYFELQLLSVKNYYNNISLGNIDFQTSVIDFVYTADSTMAYYAKSENRIGQLFAETLEMASIDIENYIDNNDQIESIDNILFVVFHAGLGQEASQDFDATIYDIRSAYIDATMLSEIQNSSEEWWINNNNITNGLLMPETLNWIFYDNIEDIFPPSFISESELENLYCDSQIGLSGLFAHLLGYHFGFPVMSNIETGETRIGRFGLMDVGWSNKNGIIPPRPNPWTRSNNNINIPNWIDNKNKTEDLYQSIQDSESSITVNVQKVDNVTDEIFQFNISPNEYFLIENRSNQLLIDNELYADKSIDCIVDYYRDYPSLCPLDPELEASFEQDDFEYDEDEDDFQNIFDVIEEFGTFYNDTNNNSLSDSNIFQIHDTYNIITKVKNYDYGLYGSGLLIWHIDEPDISSYNSGVNNDLNNRSISLEEGDAIKHIGYPNNDLFVDFSNGNRSDFWYLNNLEYQSINYGSGTTNAPIFFRNSSLPNTRFKNNINSYLSFEVKSTPSDDMQVEVNLDYDDFYDIIYLGDNLYIIGNNGDGCIFYAKNDNIYKKCELSDVVLTQEDLGEESQLIEEMSESSRILFNNNITYLVADKNHYIDSDGQIKIMDENFSHQGYYDNLDELQPVSDVKSLGDIDLDGFDEKILIYNGNIECYNSNETLCSGFPVYGSFLNIPLIVDIMDGDNKPEIICENNDIISIYSNTGDLLLDIPNYSIDQEIQIVPNWSSGKAALVNGNRLFIFNSYESSSSYWLNPGSNPSNNFIVSGIEKRAGLNQGIGGIDLSRTYNYPNPITDGYTKFRFFTYNAEYVIIKIYDLSGVLIKKLTVTNLINNDYNEIRWDASGLDSGLYFAEIKSNLNESKLIKVVLVK